MSQKIWLGENLQVLKWSFLPKNSVSLEETQRISEQYSLEMPFWCSGKKAEGKVHITFDTTVCILEHYSLVARLSILGSGVC